MGNEEFKKFLNYDYSSFSTWLFSLDAYTFTAIGTAIGFIISPSLTINQQNSLGNFFELLGQVILTINAQNSTLKQKRAQQSNLTKEKITNYEDEITKLKDEVDRLRTDALNN